MNWSAEKFLPDYLKRFEAYVPSKPDKELIKLYGCPQVFRLNNNENPLGPPNSAKEVIATFTPDKAAVYPSGDSYYLREKLAEKFGIHPDQILVGNGANEVISFVIKAFCEQGDNIITADKTFAVYEWVAEFSGIQAKLIPLKNFGFDAEAMLDAIDARTKILFVCNPNNPTGSYWDKKRFQSFMNNVRGNQIVVVDEAYFEFVERPDYPNGLDFLDEYPNLIVFRTFSKMYGLAGLRIGYLVSSAATVNVVKKTCIVYSVNSLAQDAAIAALDDDEHVQKTRQLIRSSKQYLENELEARGFEFLVRGR